MSNRPVGIQLSIGLCYGCQATVVSQFSLCVCMTALGMDWITGCLSWFQPSSQMKLNRGWDSSVVRAPDLWLKGRGFESLQERWDNFLLQGQLSVLLFRYLFHPHVTAVACKRPRSFCQMCRGQVTAKHSYTLCMWLCMKWHGAWLYCVHRPCAETAAVSCGTSHASAVNTLLRWIFKNAL